MEERRDTPPDTGSGTSMPRQIRAGLSPVQQAQRNHAGHASQCEKCRDIDRERCAVGEQLWQDWTAACNEAYRRLHEETR